MSEAHARVGMWFWDNSYYFLLKCEAQTCIRYNDAGMDPAGSGRGVHQSRVGVDQRYKYMGLGVDHGGRASPSM